jgi:hypothetical protein
MTVGVVTLLVKMTHAVLPGKTIRVDGGAVMVGAPLALRTKDQPFRGAFLYGMLPSCPDVEV